MELIKPGQTYGQNSKFCQFWGPYSTLCKINVKYGIGQRKKLVPNFTLTGAQCRPWWAKNLFFGPVSKQNTRHAGQRATKYPARWPASKQNTRHAGQRAVLLVKISTHYN